MARLLIPLPSRFWLLLALVSVACATQPEPSPRIVTKVGGDLGPDATSRQASRKAPSSPIVSQGTNQEVPDPPSQTARKFETLSMEAFLPAPMFVPTIATPKGGYRMVVVAHGAGGRGEHHCDFWNERLPLDVWLICPQGSLLDRRDPSGGAYFPDHRALREELRAVRQTLVKMHDARIQTGKWTFIGYSQGATMGALAIVSPNEAGEPEQIFTRLLLIEGGGEYWTLRRAQSFKKAGGQSVTLACGTNGCREHARRSVPVLERADLVGAFVDAKNGGHTYGGKVAAALAAEIDKMF